MNFYQKSIDYVVKHFKTNLQTGLTNQEASKRLNTFGLNELPHKKPTSLFILFLKQFLNPLMAILTLAMFASILLYEFKDAIVIAIAALINVTVGFIQESKAEKEMFALKIYETQFCNVRRNGKIFTIDSKILVPGDIILLSAGDKVPADIRLTNTLDLKLDESILTGESKPIEKVTHLISEKKITAEQKNMAFSGTFILSGKAEGIIVATGIKSYLGQIAELVTKTEESATPLQNQILNLSWLLGGLMVAISTSVIFIGFLRKIELHKIITIAIALAVASVPEGLLVTVTAILAVGMQKMFKRKALVRHLVAAETLGSVSVICTDKTGTLTEGKMLVSEVITADKEVFKIDYSQKIKSDKLKKIITLGVLNNDAQLQEEALFKGNPTDIAILKLAEHLNMDIEVVRKNLKRLEEIPFSSDLKYMVTLNDFDKLKKLILKGAPERVFKFCKQTPELENFKDIANQMVSQGLRVLGIAAKNITSGDIKSNLNDLNFYGLIGIKDPLRPKARQTVKELLDAGIKLVVVTGDHKVTAMRIAEEAGLKTEEKNIITGTQLNEMSDSDLEARIKTVDIFARVDPKHKIRIVNAFKNVGEAVAMIGDGVNDAPALKAADIGVALGSGSDVAHEISDMVLLDNNLSSIDAAVKEGRTIFDNIRKILVYLITDSFSEVTLICGSILVGLPLPLLATQIFWINLVTDGFPDLALIMEPSEPEIMKEPPRPKNEPLLNLDMKILIFLIGIITDLGLFGMYFTMYKLNFEIMHIRTILFSALAIDSLFYAYAVKSFRKSIFKTDLLNNVWLIYATIIGFGLQLSALYVPFLRNLFEVTTLSLLEWIIILGMSLIKIITIEIGKSLIRIKKCTH